MASDNEDDTWSPRNEPEWSEGLSNIFSEIKDELVDELVDFHNDPGITKKNVESIIEFNDNPFRAHESIRPAFYRVAHRKFGDLYCILEATNSGELGVQVNAMMSHGWKPLGSVSVGGHGRTIHPRLGVDLQARLVYAQAMTKEN